MADLSFIEKHKLEKLLGMGGGYVLDFTNRTFSEFVVDSTGKNIWDSRYGYGSGSKANRLRGFWNEEPNHVVGKLIADLLDYCRERDSTSVSSDLHEDCRRIVQRLRGIKGTFYFSTATVDLGLPVGRLTECLLFTSCARPVPFSTPLALITPRVATADWPDR